MRIVGRAHESNPNEAKHQHVIPEPADLAPVRSLGKAYGLACGQHHHPPVIKSTFNTVYLPYMSGYTVVHACEMTWL